MTSQKGWKSCPPAVQFWPALSIFGHRCPNLASVVHSWPVLAIFGQSCPEPVEWGMPGPLFCGRFGTRSQENPFPFRQNGPCRSFLPERTIVRRPVEQCGAFPAVRSAIVHLGKMDLLGRRLSLQATPAGSGYCACGLPQAHKVCDASQRDSLSLGKSRAVDGAGADLGRSAPRVMYGPRLATPGAG